MKTLFAFLTRYPKRALTLAILWTSLILVACFLPGNDVPKVNIVNFDKLVHVALFGGCVFLWAIALIRYSEKMWPKLLLIFAATVGLGILVELIQGSSLVEGRSADVYDVIADSVGAFFGMWLSVSFLRAQFHKNECQED